MLLHNSAMPKEALPARDKPFVTVASVVHALNILRLLTRAPAPQGVSAIARELGISPSSCFNLLKTLCSEGVVEFDPAAKSYRLGAAVSEFAAAGSADAAPALALARPRLMAMAAEYRLASGLWRVSAAGRLVLTDFVDSEMATRIHMNVGQRLPSFIGAMGRCVAAHTAFAGSELKDAFAQLRWARPPTLDRYRKEVARVKSQGWALDDGDFMRGVSTVAAPVLDRGGAVRYCIANTFFQGEHDAAGTARIGAATAACAREVAQLLYKD